MKKQMQEKPKKAKKLHDLKIKKQTVKDLDAEKASKLVKGGGVCIPSCYRSM
jgi:hypothetical protein